MQALPKIRFVVATREDKSSFFTQTATGRSLAAYKFPFVQLILAPNNKQGLPVIYNRAIELARADPSIMVFAHDDLHLCDFFWANKMAAALKRFDIVGLAGNKRRVPNQPSWAFVNANLQWDERAHLSGVVGHGAGFPPKKICTYGPSGQEVKLLDGLMLVAHSETLIRHRLQFDEQFPFHFYDMDLCRQAEAQGVKMGTWPISVVHESAGNFRSESWQQGYAQYLKKWGA
jgi:GT2 family glycosyltransferase